MAISICRSTRPLLRPLLEAIVEWRHIHRRYPQHSINLALGVHGQVDPITGVSQTMPQARWKTPIEIKYRLRSGLACRVRVDNDRVMLALAEKWQHQGTQQDFLRDQRRLRYRLVICD